MVATFLLRRESKSTYLGRWDCFELLILVTYYVP